MKLRYYSENYRGVHAKQDIKNGETILYVPLKQIITLEMAFQSPIGKLMYEKGLRQRLISPKHSFLGAYIMQEKRKMEMEYREYLDILPKGLNDFPIFFNEDERSYLKGSPFLTQIFEKIEDIKVDYNLICKEVPEFSQFSLREYSESRVFVSSRIFGITVNGVKTDGFVPLADMLNHKRPRQTTWYYSDEREGFIIEACDDIPRGEQVYDSYGRKCNSRFFLNYGFINMNNDANEIPISIHVDDKEELYDLKMNLINSAKSYMKFRVVDNLEEPVMSEFISWLRFVNYKGDITALYLAKNEAMIEAQKRQANIGSDDDDENDFSDAFKGTTLKFMGIDLEINVWKHIKELCETQMGLYETTMEEDEKILEGDTLTQNQRACVLYRHGEKKILHYLLFCCENIPPLFKMTLKEAKKVVNSNKAFEESQSYIRNNVYTALQPNLTK